MKDDKPSTQFWAVLTTMNVLALLYPIHLLLHAKNPGQSFLATLAFVGVVFLLAVLDVVSIVIADVIVRKS